MMVPLPERLGRRMSLGPFEDPHDLLRFLLIASLGALVALRTGAIGWLPFGAVGALLTLVRIDEESLGDLLLRRIRFHLRPRRRPVPSAPSAADGRPGARRAAGVRDLSGGTWEIWERAPSPVSGRDAGELFQEGKELLRALAGRGPVDVLLVRTGTPWDLRPYVPVTGALPARERAIRAGYAALLFASTRGRRRARLLLALRSRGPEEAQAEAGTPSPLEGIGWRRLRGAELGSAARSLLPLSSTVGRVAP